MTIFDMHFVREHVCVKLVASVADEIEMLIDVGVLSLYVPEQTEFRFRNELTMLARKCWQITAVCFQVFLESAEETEKLATLFAVKLFIINMVNSIFMRA